MTKKIAKQRSATSLKPEKSQTRPTKSADSAKGFPGTDSRSPDDKDGNTQARERLANAHQRTRR